jgi:hypothetical protein
MYLGRGFEDEGRRAQHRAGRDGEEVWDDLEPTPIRPVVGMNVIVF